jgi:hypothetical protein
MNVRATATTTAVTALWASGAALAGRGFLHPWPGLHYGRVMAGLGFPVGGLARLRDLAHAAEVPLSPMGRLGLARCVPAERGRLASRALAAILAAGGVTLLG